MTTFDWWMAGADVVLFFAAIGVMWWADRRVKRLWREGKLRDPKG